MAKLLFGIEENAANCISIVLLLAPFVNRALRSSVYLPKPQLHPPVLKPGAYRASGLVQSALWKASHKAEQALNEIKAWVEANGLTLHPDKTHVGDCRQEGQGFDFLGYRFEAGKRWIRKKSLMALKDKIRTLTQRTRGDSLARIIADLNPRLKGWFGYFKHAEVLEFKRMDGFIRRRLRALLRKQEKRPGMGRCLADHLRWPNAYFAAAGLFTMTEARLLASQSR